MADRYPEALEWGAEFSERGRRLSWFNGNGHFEKSAMMAEEVSDDGRETPDLYRRV